MKKSKLREVMSELGKLSNKKSPRPRSFYVMMGKKSGKVRRKLIHNLYTDDKLTTHGELD